MKTLIAKYRLSNRAFEYFGGDVQSFALISAGGSEYQITQRPHWGNERLAACTHASTAREAVKVFNEMAAMSDRRYS